MVETWAVVVGSKVAVVLVDCWAVLVGGRAVVVGGRAASVETGTLATRSDKRHENKHTRSTCNEKELLKTEAKSNQMVRNFANFVSSVQR